jgi:transposase-like protein
MNEVSFLQILKWSDEECRSYLERMHWPNGAHCPKCGANSPYKITRRTPSKNFVKTLYRCRSCQKQFTATVGTIFEDSKIPLNKWFATIYLMCASKKGISAHQIHRQLGITYKSAWFMCHRIREAMRDKGILSPLTGTIEADETYVGGKKRGHRVWREFIKDEVEMGLREKPKRHPRMDKAVVFGMLERDGTIRTRHIKEMNSKTVQGIMARGINLNESRLITDNHSAFRLIRRYLPHDIIRHEIEYVNGDIHTQGIENYWSLLKRGLYGVFHHVDAEYLHNYLNEFEFRFNRRKIEDAERFAALMGQTQGRVLWYCQTPQPENPFA